MRSLNSTLRFLLHTKPWLYPLLWILLEHKREYATPFEISKRLGSIATSIVRRGLWFLKKYNMIDVRGKPLKVKLKPEIANEASKVLNEEVLKFNGKRMVVKLKRRYLLVTIRRRKVVVKAVDDTVMLKVLKALRDSLGQEYTVKELSEATLTSPSKTAITIRILTLLGKVVRMGNKFKYVEV